MIAAGKYTAVLKVTALTSLAYQGDVLFRCLNMALVLFVFVQLWTATFGLGGFQSMAGFTLRDIIWYLVVTETVVMSAPRVSERIDEEVKSGEIARALIRPYSYVGYHLSAYWGEAAIRLPIVVALGAAVALIAAGPPAVSPAAILAAALMVVLSMTLNFLFEASIGLLAFWFEDTIAFFWIYQKLVFTIGGLFLPLELLPGPLAEVSSKLPFAAVAYAPARVFVDFSYESFAELAALQLVWIAVLVLVVAVIYRRGVREVNINGG